ncbi:sugar ABC transporter substrate-binding protein [Actinobacteria bacterium YIM 96077]|uniref:Sugar ABC transporter substrate-binding protein n=2 Tax=Phytoactinopolyspora halophila TaxID=1981511 RepID=A0A329QW86_9ACTN|nr:sugar ABC transporter substrate-binding protein [Actinobacteria bacterium YIM 96077]RAW15572.1 sugar ABC transporter substrate-binding protein [Phytoactinopolyspora halophila]
MPRRLVSSLGTTAVLSLVLAACGGDGDADSATGDGGDGTLTVSVWNLEGTPEFQALFDAFEEAHPDITVEPVDILADDYEEKLTAMLAGGDQTDVITIKNVMEYGEYANRGQLLDITDVVESADTSDLAGLEAFDVDGSYFAMPYRQDFWVIYYNKTLFDEAGIDYPDTITWDEYVDIAEQLTEGEDEDKVYGTYHHTWRSVTQAISAAQTGGDLLGGDYSFFADQYEVAVGLQESGAAMDFGTANAQQASYQTMFETGATAMLPMGTWYIAAILAAEERGDTDVDWGIAPMAQRPDTDEVISFGSPTAFAVNENAANADAAKEFVEFAASAEGAKAIAEIGVVPALQTSEITETYFSLDGMPDDELSKKAFEPDVVELEMPVSERTADIDEILNQEHELIMVGDKSIEDGLSTMSERVRTEVRD